MSYMACQVRAPQILKQVGIGACYDVCLIPLPGVNLADVFLVPAAHTMLFGVAKNVMDQYLRSPKEATGRPTVISQALRRLMSERASDIVVSDEFGRRYTDVVRYR